MGTIRDHLRQTHTYVTLEISKAAYDEIAKLLRNADYGHAFNDDGEIDMHGLALVACKEAPRDPQAGPPGEQYNDHCKSGPCASEICRDTKRCMHES